MSLPLEKRLETLSRPVADSLGLRLVGIQIFGTSSLTLRIIVERADETPMGIEDCTALSRQLSALFDVEDPIAGAYTLEVSSAGIDRPLFSKEDFLRYTSHMAKVEMKDSQEGQRRFKGVIEGVAEDFLSLRLEEGETVQLPLEGIQRAKLVLTEDLLKKALRGEAPSSVKKNSRA